MAPVIVVRLDKDVFFPGERVSGMVCVLTSKPRRCEGISVKFRGHAEVMLVSAAARYDAQRPATEEYYQRELLLWRESSGKLKVGKHVFRFHFDLPSSIPATFQGLYGNVEHYCKVEMKVKHSLNPKVKKIFTVLSGPLSEPFSTIPDSIQSRADNILSAKCGDVSVNVEIDGTIYDPRETIIIDAEITNNSSKKITSTSAVFYMSVEYCTRRSKRVQQYEVASRTHPPVAPHSAYSWGQDDIVVPILPATGLDGCGIITVSYGIKFTVHRKLPASSLVLDFPIIIGSALDNGAVHHLDSLPPSPTTVEAPEPLISAFSNLSIPDSPSDTSFSSTGSSEEDHMGRTGPQVQLEVSSPAEEDPKVSSKVTKLVSLDVNPSYFTAIYVFQNDHGKTRN